MRVCYRAQTLVWPPHLEISVVGQFEKNALGPVHVPARKSGAEGWNSLKLNIKLKTLYSRDVDMQMQFNKLLKSYT